MTEIILSRHHLRRVEELIILSRQSHLAASVLDPGMHGRRTDERVTPVRAPSTSADDERAVANDETADVVGMKTSLLVSAPTVAPEDERHIGEGTTIGAVQPTSFAKRTPERIGTTEVTCGQTSVDRYTGGDSGLALDPLIHEILERGSPKDKENGSQQPSPTWP